MASGYPGVVQAKSEAVSKPTEKACKSSMASFSINASSLRRQPLAPAAPASAHPQPEEAAAPTGSLYRTSSNGTAKTMSIDGADSDDVSSAATTSTADSGRRAAVHPSVHHNWVVPSKGIAQGIYLQCSGGVCKMRPQQGMASGYDL